MNIIQRDEQRSPYRTFYSLFALPNVVVQTFANVDGLVTCIIHHVHKSFFNVLFFYLNAYALHVGTACQFSEIQIHALQSRPSFVASKIDVLLASDASFDRSKRSTSRMGRTRPCTCTRDSHIRCDPRQYAIQRTLSYALPDDTWL